MSYKLRFMPSALKEWQRLDNSVRSQFKKILEKRLVESHVPSAALHNMPDCYKIKLRQLGYRLIYQVQDNIITVEVVAIGRRDKGSAYKEAERRLTSPVR